MEDPTLSIYPAIALVVSDDYLAKNGDTLRRVLAAYHQAKQAIRRGLTEDELAAVKKRFFPDMPEAAWTGGLKLTMPNLIGPLAPSRAQFDALFAVHNATAEVPASVTYEQCFDARIADSVEKA